MFKKIFQGLFKFDKSIPQLLTEAEDLVNYQSETAQLMQDFEDSINRYAEITNNMKRTNARYRNPKS